MVRARSSTSYCFFPKCHLQHRGEKLFPIFLDSTSTISLLWNICILSVVGHNLSLGKLKQCTPTKSSGIYKMSVKKRANQNQSGAVFADRGYMHNRLLNISTISISPNRTNWPNNKVNRGNLHLRGSERGFFVNRKCLFLIAVNRERTKLFPVIRERK